MIDKDSNLGYTSVTMKKQMISFTDPQIDFLELRAKQLGVSVAEMVRRSVDWYRDTYPDQNSAKPEKKK